MAGTWERRGTVKVTQNSKVVIGAGTYWTDAQNGPQVGNTFYGPNGQAHEVAVIRSATELWLADNYKGATATGAAYQIDTTRVDSVPGLASRVAAVLAFAQGQYGNLDKWLLGPVDQDVTLTSPNGETATIPTWPKIANTVTGQAAVAKTEADRAVAAAAAATDVVAASALPLPDVWAPLSDSLRLITGYGRDVLVGSDVVARMVNFSRNSAATYIGKDGLLKTAAANEPRFEKEGLLIEGQSTNLIRNSATLTTQTISVQAGTYTLSFYGTGSVSLSGASSGVLTGNGAGMRVGRTFTATAGNLTLTVVGACTNGQLEALPFASSYIPTAGAAATRAADVLLLDGINMPTGIKTVAVNFTCTVNAAAPHGMTLFREDVYSASNRQTLSVTPSGVMSLSEGNGVIDSGGRTEPKTPQIAAAVFSGPSSKLALNGVISKTQRVPITVSNSIYQQSWRIGDNATYPSSIYGHVRNLRIWLRSLTDDQLKAVA